MSLVTERIEAAWREHAGWTYTLRRPQVPERLPGIPEEVQIAPRGKPGVTNCSTWGVFALLRAHPDAHLAYPGFYMDVQVFDGRRPFSPVDAVDRAQIGVPVASLDAVPFGRWGISETWSRLDASGHVVAGVSFGHLRVWRRTEQGLRVLEASGKRGRMVESSQALGKVASWGTETRSAMLAEVEVRPPGRFV